MGRQAVVVVVRGKGARGFHNSEGHFLGDTLSPCWAPATDLPVLADREVGPASLVAWQVPGSRRRAGAHNPLAGTCYPAPGPGGETDKWAVKF